MLPRLVGRAPEQRAIADVLARASSGHLQVVGIEGPPGIGKSSLLEDTLLRLQGWTVLRCRLDRSAPQVRLGAVAELAAPLGWDEAQASDDASTVARWLRERIEELSGPVCLAIEDAHLIDRESTAALLQLGRQVTDLPIVALATTRPERGAETSALARLAREPGRGRWLVLAPLGRDGVRELFSDRLDAVLDGPTVGRVLDATGGYPIYLEELVHRLGTSQDPDDTLTTTLVRLQGAASDRLLTDRVRGVLAGTSPDTAAALLAISLGDELSWDQVSLAVEARGLPSPRRGDVLGTGLVVATSRDTLRPRHAIMGQSVIDESSAADVRATHSALGQVVPGSAGLLYRARSAQPGDAGADLVAELSDRALHHMLSGDGALAVNLSLAAARLDPTKASAAAIMAMRVRRPDLVAQVEGHLRDETRPATRQALHALLCATRQDLDEALAELAASDPEACDDESLTVLGYAAHETSRVAVTRGRFHGAELAGRVRDALVRRRQAALEEGWPAEFLAEYSNLVALLGMWSLMSELDPTDGRELIRRSEALEADVAQWPGTERVLGVLVSIRCSYLIYSGRYDDAVREIREHADQSVADPDSLVGTTYTQLQVLFQSGRWDEALLLARAALGRTLDRLNDPSRRRLAAAAAAIPGCRGESTVAHEEGAPSADGHPVLERCAQALTEAWAWVSRGDRDPARAAEVAAGLDQSWRDGAAGSFAGGLPVAVLRVRAHLLAGDADRARAVAQEIERGSYDELVRRYLRAHIRALLTSPDDPRESEERFSEAAVALAAHLADQPEQGLHLYRAVLAEDWADRVRARGGTPSAALRDELAKGVSVLRACGAASWRTRLGRLADPDGAQAPAGRPLQAVADLDPLDELTSREREIARLVADGLTNREIAAVLFLSVRTVEYHISNALRKLGHASRVELRSALRRRAHHAS